MTDTSLHHSWQRFSTPSLRGFVVAVAALWLGCPALARDVPTAFHATKLAEVDAIISLAISDGRCPGGVVWIERDGAAHHRAFGDRAVEPVRERTTEDTIYDAASLTKVVSTTTAIMQLVERGKLKLEARVSDFIPEFRGSGKEAITVQQLLTHTSGLSAGLPLKDPWSGIDAAIALACAEPLPNAPGTSFRYSDINFILLGELVRRASGETLESFCAANIFEPLGMKDTGYLPPAAVLMKVAPTERSCPRGAVHDPTARRMGGVAGHAGLFTTAHDLARFARMMLGGGELDGARILQPETVNLMTSVHTPDSVPARRGLGWDIDSAYAGPRGEWFPIGSFGHTGWTGGSLWIDPFSKTFVIFLSNRNHPTESGNVIPLRRTLGTIAAEAVRGFNFLHVPGALPVKPGGTAIPPGYTAAIGHPPVNVFTGIDVLARDEFKPLRGLKVGLVTNHTGIDRQRRSTIDLLSKAPEVQLVSLFSPEHGIRGVMDEKVGDSRDEKTGLPIYSLYGATRAPTGEQLVQLDALVFDIQDIGCRFYTYISTLGECLTAAAKAGKRVFVLDRPNPITGLMVEGPMLEGERSFTAWHSLPVRHGMTVGELAKMFNEERKLGCDLSVIPCEGWTRGMWFDEVSQPWVNPSPNMRTLHAAVLYPGVGLLEFCNLSVGRGTDRPFELFGAPYIDDLKFAAALNAFGLAGVRFIPARFTPTASVFKGQECRGVQLVVTDRNRLSAVDVGIALALTMQRFHAKDAKLERLARLLVHPPTHEAIREGKSLHEVRALWAADRETFTERRRAFLIYP